MLELIKQIETIQAAAAAFLVLPGRYGTFVLYLPGRWPSVWQITMVHLFYIRRQLVNVAYMYITYKGGVVWQMVEAERRAAY